MPTREQTLEGDELYQRISNIGDVTSYIQETYGNADPEDLRALEINMTLVADIAMDEVKRLRGEIPLAEQMLAQQLDSIENDLRNWANNYLRYFKPLQEDAFEGDPLLATDEWVRDVRNPMVFGIMPDGERTVPFSVMPFIALNQTQTREADFVERLAERDVFHYIKQETAAQFHELEDVVRGFDWRMAAVFGLLLAGFLLARRD